MNDLTPDEPSNVVCLNGEVKRSLEITRKEQSEKAACYGIHKRITVDSENRLVECEVCGRVVEPFDYLEQWAKEGDRRMQELNRITAQTRITAAEHAALTKQVQNLRATLKRHGQPQTREERHRFNEMRWNPEKVSAL